MRQYVFLEHKLQSIGQRLQQTHRPDAVRTDAVLHPRAYLALRQHRVRHNGQHHPEHAGDLDEMNEEQLDHAFAPTVAAGFSDDATEDATVSKFSSTPWSPILEKFSPANGARERVMSAKTSSMARDLPSAPSSLS